MLPLQNFLLTIFNDVGCLRPTLNSAHSLSTIALLFHLTIQTNTLRLSSMRSHPLLPFDDDDVCPFSQADITFETVPHHTLAISKAFVTEAPAKCALTITPHLKSPRSSLVAMLVLNTGL